MGHSPLGEQLPNIGRAAVPNHRAVDDVQGIRTIGYVAGLPKVLRDIGTRILFRLRFWQRDLLGRGIFGSGLLLRT